MTAIAATVVIVATSGCGVLDEPFQVAVDDEGRTVDAVRVDRSGIDTRKAFDATFFSFFPGELSLHPGDEALFQFDSGEEPHTITFGTLVDEAAAALDELGLAVPIAEMEALPEMQALPHVLPVESSDRPEVNRSAAEPCYLDEGTPPSDPAGGGDACADRDRPKFDGRQTFYNSGWLEDADVFRLELADDIEPGTYAYMCLIHRSAMRGTVDVVDSGRGLPGIGDVGDQASTEAAGLASRLSTAAKLAWDARPDAAVAGAGERNVPGAVLSFGKSTYNIAVGGSMSWSVFGTHTISFDPTDDAQDGLLLREDGRVRLNREAWESRGGTSPPDEARSYPGPTTEAPLVIDGGEWDGRGRLSSGVLRAAAPASLTYELTFTREGTYSYVCLIHPTMSGKVEVG